MNLCLNEAKLKAGVRKPNPVKGKVHPKICIHVILWNKFYFYNINIFIFIFAFFNDQGLKLKKNTKISCPYMNLGTESVCFMNESLQIIKNFDGEPIY